MVLKRRAPYLAVEAREVGRLIKAFNRRDVEDEPAIALSNPPNTLISFI